MFIIRIFFSVFKALRYVLKTIWHSLKGFFRESNLKHKAIFALSIMVLIGVMQIMILFVESEILIFCMQWSFIPVSLLYLIIRYGEVRLRYKFKHFFLSNKICGFDGKLPTYVKSVKLNQYLKMYQLKSLVPLIEWEKNKPYLEMFYNSKIYKIETQERAKKQNADLRTVNIYTIENLLPEYIEWENEYALALGDREFAVGESYDGQVIWNAKDINHGIVAGATSGGKTTLLRLIAEQAISKDYEMSILDFKYGGDYMQIERDYQEHNNTSEKLVISEPEEARDLLVNLLAEVKRRTALFNEVFVTNFDEYNTIHARSRPLKPFLLIIDEAAEIFDVKPKDKEEKALYVEIDKTLRTLARTSRAAGVNILLGIIRPDAEVISGQIKNNLSWRVCAYFKDSAASKIVLENDRATELSPDIKGRFIIGDEEVQAYYKPIQKDNQNN